MKGVDLVDRNRSVGFAHSVGFLDGSGELVLGLTEILLDLVLLLDIILQLVQNATLLFKLSVKRLDTSSRRIKLLLFLFRSSVGL